MKHVRAVEERWFRPANIREVVIFFRLLTHCLLSGLIIALSIDLSLVQRSYAQSKPAALCNRGIEVAQRVMQVPPRLIEAIALAESGKRDASGSWHPWPWTIDVNGQGQFFATKAEAIATVQILQAGGVRSIDVGCMQVNLMHHPDAFASLDQAFDPQANVAYATRFLTSLYNKAGNWPTAVGLYHSSNAELGVPYRSRVLALVSGQPFAPAPRISKEDRQRGLLEAAWRATVSEPEYATLVQGGRGTFALQLSQPKSSRASLTAPPNRYSQQILLPPDAQIAETNPDR